MQHPDRWRGKHNDTDAIPALHTGFSLGQDVFDLPIRETVLVDSVPKNTKKVTLYCQVSIGFFLAMFKFSIGVISYKNIRLIHIGVINE